MSQKNQAFHIEAGDLVEVNLGKEEETCALDGNKPLPVADLSPGVVALQNVEGGYVSWVRFLHPEHGLGTIQSNLLGQVLRERSGNASK